MSWRRVSARRPIVGGVTYVATALTAPGVIDQTGTHRRIVFGEVFGVAAASDRARRRDPRRACGRRHSGRSGSPMAGCRSGRSSSFSCPWRGSPARPDCRSARFWPTIRFAVRFLDGCREIERLARAEGVPIAPDIIERIGSYVDGIPKSMRSSLLIDLAQGKRIEVEQLQGSVVRRAARAGIHVPIMSTLYSVLKPWANGARQSD